MAFDMRAYVSERSAADNADRVLMKNYLKNGNLVQFPENQQIFANHVIDTRNPRRNNNMLGWGSRRFAG